MKLWKSAWHRAAAMALVSVLLGGFILYLYVPLYPGGYQYTYVRGLENEEEMEIWRVPWDFAYFWWTNDKDTWEWYHVVYVKKAVFIRFLTGSVWTHRTQKSCAKSAMCRIPLRMRAEIGYGSSRF